MLFGDDVANRQCRSGHRSLKVGGLLACGLGVCALLAGCQSESLKDVLTTPPSVSGNAKTASTAVTSAPVSAPTPGPVENDVAAATPRRHARSSHPRRHATAANQDLKAQQHGTATQNAPFVEQGVAKGATTYPKFVPPKAATSQMTDAEKKRFEDTMAARLKASQQPAETPAEAAERQKLLKALADKQTQDTLDSIGK